MLLFLFGCNQDSGGFSGGTTKKRTYQGSTTVTSGPEGLHRQGELEMEQISNEGRIKVDTSSEDDQYESIISFDDGTQLPVKGKGLGGSYYDVEYGEPTK